MSFDAGARPTPVAKSALNQGSAYLRGTDAVEIGKVKPPQGTPRAHWYMGSTFAMSARQK